MWRKKTRHQGENSKDIMLARVKIKTNMSVLHHNGASNNYFVFSPSSKHHCRSHFSAKPHHKHSSYTGFFALFFYVLPRRVGFYCNASEIKMFFNIFLLLLIFYASSFIRRAAFTKCLNWMIKVVKNFKGLSFKSSNFLPFFKLFFSKFVRVCQVNKAIKGRNLSKSSPL